MGCEESSYTPKPLGYFRIDLPEKEYQHYSGSCPYNFDYPVRSLLDTMSQRAQEKCWVNLHYPQHRATIHLTYVGVDGNNLDEYLEDSRNMAMKHTVRADAIEEQFFQNPEKRVYGLIYNFEGNTATNFQFFLTDSTDHFLSGSMYFNVAPNSDSLEPVSAYIKEDLRRLIESFSWDYGNGAGQKPA
ncbi:gliding motility lipoprotein GldD [bacterium SCSIO 12741]|nr:gliding motility lipoprotein GldD [bacterium SCSIO 12741]